MHATDSMFPAFMTSTLKHVFDCTLINVVNCHSSAIITYKKEKLASF